MKHNAIHLYNYDRITYVNAMRVGASRIPLVYSVFTDKPHNGSVYESHDRDLAGESTIVVNGYAV